MKILETGLYVDNLDQAEEFYVDKLGLELVAKKEGRHLFIKCEDRMLVIFNPKVTTRPGSVSPMHGAEGAGHMAFGVTGEELDKWKGKMLQLGIDIEKTVDWENGRQSIYFRDPSGNSLEFIHEDFWDHQ